MTWTSDMPVLECEDLSISYFTRRGEVPAVVDFNLKLFEGESVGLVGESGCGKSTVALAILRYLGNNGRVVGGRILFKGRDLATLGDEDLRRLRGNEIAMVYQEPANSLNPSLTLGRQLAEVPLCHETIDEGEAWKRARHMLERVKLPDPDRIMESYMHQVSGGQQQRVVIAMALLSGPDLLLLDEPTTALDVTVEAGIVELIADIARHDNMSMLYISHNLGLIVETCSRVTVMYSGIAVEDGDIARVFGAMKHPYSQGLMRAIPLPGTDRRTRPLEPIPGQLPLPDERPQGCFFGPRCDFFQQATCGAAPIPMTAVIEGQHHVRCSRWEEIAREERLRDAALAPVTIGETVLEVDGVRKVYEIEDTSLAAFFGGGRPRELKANEKVAFDARQSETVAIVGESGCGKTTFAKVLMGLETATSGEVHFEGRDVARMPVRKRPAALISTIQMVFQNPFDTLNPSHSVGAQLGRSVRRFSNLASRADVEARVHELLDLVKLPREFTAYKPRQLSGGQKQRVGIARAFAGNPVLVVADEPVSALDVSVQAAITRLLQDVQHAHKTTLLLISHDLGLVRYLADRVVVMYLGHVVETGTVDQIFSPPYHPYTEALLSAIPIADISIERKRIILEGDLPSALDPPSGCPFHTRCHRMVPGLCDSAEPPVLTADEGHDIACHLPLEDLEAVEPVFARG